MQEYDEKNPATHKGYDLRSMPMAALYKAYGLDPMTVDFIGHALALHRCLFAFPHGLSPDVHNLSPGEACVPKSCVVKGYLPHRQISGRAEQ